VPRQVALLRGINVGGHRKVPMAELRALAERLGHDEVATYVQSGNLVSTVAERPEAEAVAELEAAIEAQFGFAVPVVVRTREQLAAVVAANPLASHEPEDKHHHVLFLAEEPAPERLAEIDLGAVDPDVCVARGRELYLWTPGGIHASKLARTLSDKRLGTTVTARNWRTVEALLALAG
jgi:uncharacterized protein (DUF1697 family)